MVSDVFARIQVHIFATLICLVMLVETQNHKDSRQYSFRLFRAQLIACILDFIYENIWGGTVFGAYAFFWYAVAVAWMMKMGVFGPELAAACDLRLSIPGSGAVESLNVASATAVLLARWASNAS